MKGFRGISFRSRVFLSCLLAALVPLLLSSIVMIQLFTASLNRQNMVEGERQLKEVCSRFSQLLENGGHACERLTEDGSAARVMIDNSTVSIQKDLYLLLYQAVQEIYGYAQFSLYDAGGRLRFTTNTSMKSESLPVYWGLLKKAAPNRGITYYRTDPYLSVTDSGVLLQGAYSLENSHGARTGYIVLDFTRDNFENLLKGCYSSEDTLLLLDDHRRPFYCSRQEYGEKQMEEIISCAVSGTETGEDYLSYLWAQEPACGFYVLLCRKAPISAPAVRTMGTVSLALSGLGLLLCLVISGTLTRSIAQPVRQLDKAMAQVKKGDLSVRVRSERRDELGRLTESFNRMTEDLKRYLDDAVQKQKDLNETSLKLYQTQLNPHFLYNTLDSIKWSARINRIPEIAVMAENLAVILRKSISSHPFITLKEELETIDSYIQIQKIRFTGRFLYETEVQDQLEDCMVPKMILQPLVENAIIHGLDGCENGYICVYGIQKEEKLCISVTDDGCGMSREMTEWINSPAPARREGHLGLYNVIRILKLYYGEEYGMTAQSSEEGTTVTVTLPFRKEAADV